ncbi:DUF1177 domain-containing protein [Enterococcus saccharolyticus]|uniref:DUF1177 domain-containing protein n=1 Tax=Candidatus Enterococcus willemsii TaxID=1857215 RepID=A0ABQ6Z2H6_9ENTE|nr:MULTISPECIES: DUF1177 domain-containing protein [Enterococcus]KAF1305738.1 hypothetical protein BAU17_00365 [Enterococcus sp. CU12B]MCD5001498.1 DUF1177 domain-containing protein [Enterococcus saccharolyticus]
MVLKQVIETLDVIDSAYVNGKSVAALFKTYSEVKIELSKVEGETGFTEFIRFTIPGKAGKTKGGTYPTLGIIGRLGGIGARPARIGMVSDADGAVSAIAAALKICDMQQKGDVLDGDVIVSTHICPDAPTEPHEPVDFMGSPVDILTMNQYEVTEEMDAILSIDTTKGNNVVNHKGIAISPTVKEGYILRISDDLVRILEMTSGNLATTFPVTTQDITPYGNDVYHINSILQPAVATNAPVVGVAITAVSAVPGCGTGASHEIDIAAATRFAVEVAKEFTKGSCNFYDISEFTHLQKLYGSLNHLQTLGKME